jgi:hypothetical protein
MTKTSFKLASREVYLNYTGFEREVNRVGRGSSNQSQMFLARAAPVLAPQDAETLVLQ